MQLLSGNHPEGSRHLTLPLFYLYEILLIFPFGGCPV